MAVCQIWKVKGRLDNSINYVTNPEKTDKNLADENLQSLRDVMEYASNSKKTSINDNEYFVTGINCQVESARTEMIMTKTIYGDDKEIIAFHGFQSFAPDEVTPDIAHEIGVKLATQMWGERFQVVVSTHLNTNCLHNHFVVNSTSFADGKRYYNNKENYRLFCKLSDELCNDYSLSVIENPDPYKSHKYIHQMEKAGMPTRHNLAKEAIDEAIRTSRTRDEFFKTLTKLGYKFDFRESRKYATITPTEYGKAIRVHKLGNEYSRERIFERIGENRNSNRSNVFKEKSYSFDQSIYRKIGIAKKKGGIYGLYLHYCYRLGILPKNKNKNNLKVNYLFRDDLRKIDKISNQVIFLHKHRFSTVEEVSLYIKSSKTEIENLKKERTKLWNSLRTKTDPSQISSTKEKIENCSARLKTLRKEVVLCDDIILKAPIIEEKILMIEQTEKQNNRKEVSYDKLR